MEVAEPLLLNGLDHVVGLGQSVEEVHLAGELFVLFRVGLDRLGVALEDEAEVPLLQAVFVFEGFRVDYSLDGRTGSTWL